MVVRRLSELAEEAIVDDTRKLSILEKCHLIDKLQILARLFWTVSAHRNVCEDSLEVGFDDLVEEFRVQGRVKVFNQDDLIVGRRSALHLRLAQQRRFSTR